MLEPKKHYVYAAVHEGEIVYIGKGKGVRWKHCTSGISSSYYLNRLHFDGAHVEAMIVQDGLDEQSCKALEGYLIGHYRPVGNSVGKFDDCACFAAYLDSCGIDYRKHERLAPGFMFA